MDKLSFKYRRNFAHGAGLWLLLEPIGDGRYKGVNLVVDDFGNLVPNG